jgi:hypothetical protein
MYCAIFGGFLGPKYSAAFDTLAEAEEHINNVYSTESAKPDWCEVVEAVDGQPIRVYEVEQKLKNANNEHAILRLGDQEFYLACIREAGLPHATARPPVVRGEGTDKKWVTYRPKKSGRKHTPILLLYASYEAGHNRIRSTEDLTWDFLDDNLNSIVASEVTLDDIMRDLEDTVTDAMEKRLVEFEEQIFGSRRSAQRLRGGIPALGLDQGTSRPLTPMSGKNQK